MTENRPSIRPLTLSDHKEWLNLYHGYAEFYRVAINDNNINNLWNWLHDAHHPCRCLVAEDENGLLGLAHFRPMPSPLRGSDIGFLDDLYVISKARGRGVGRALIDALTVEAQAQGWPVVRWITADNNYSARMLYDQMAAKTQWNTYEVIVNPI